MFSGTKGEKSKSHGRQRHRGHTACRKICWPSISVDPGAWYSYVTPPIAYLLVTAPRKAANMARRRRTAGTVEIDVHPNICEIRGLPLELARQLFGFRDIEFPPDDRGGLRPTMFINMSLAVSPNSLEGIRIPTCRLENAIRQLESRRYTVVLTEIQPRIPASRRPNPAGVPQDLPWVQDLLRALDENMVGRIVVHSERGITSPSMATATPW